MSLLNKSYCELTAGCAGTDNVSAEGVDHNESGSTGDGSDAVGADVSDGDRRGALAPTGDTRKTTKSQANIKGFFEASDIGEPWHALTGSMRSRIPTLQFGSRETADS